MDLMLSFLNSPEIFLQNFLSIQGWVPNILNFLSRMRLYILHAILFVMGLNQTSIPNALFLLIYDLLVIL